MTSQRRKLPHGVALRFDDFDALEGVGIYSHMHRPGRLFSLRLAPPEIRSASTARDGHHRHLTRLCLCDVPHDVAEQLSSCSGMRGQAQGERACPSHGEISGPASVPAREMNSGSARKAARSRWVKRRKHLSLQFSQHQSSQRYRFRNCRRWLGTRLDRLAPESNCGDDRGGDQQGSSLALRIHGLSIVGER